MSYNRGMILVDQQRSKLFYVCENWISTRAQGKTKLHSHDPPQAFDVLHTVVLSVHRNYTSFYISYYKMVSLVYFTVIHVVVLGCWLVDFYLTAFLSYPWKRSSIWEVLSYVEFEISVDYCSPDSFQLMAVLIRLFPSSSLLYCSSESSNIFE